MNILLTSVGRRSYMVSYFRDALNGNGKVHVGNCVDTYSMQIADASVLTPLIYDETYVDFLLLYCAEHNIRAIIPLFDIDLPILARNKLRFADYGIQVIVSDFETTRICNDKWMTYQFLKTNGFSTPVSYLMLDDCKKGLKNHAVRFPLILKPRFGMGSMGLFSAQNEFEMELSYKKVKAEILSSYLKYESASDLERSVLIQEELVGQEYGLDVINDLNQKYITTFVKRKIARRAGETDQAVTEDNFALKELGKAISSQLKHIANLDVDCLVVKDKAYVLDMNCRFGGGYPFSHLAGANIPLAIVQWLKGQNPPEDLFEIKYGLEGVKEIHPVILAQRIGPKE